MGIPSSNPPQPTTSDPIPPQPILQKPGVKQPLPKQKTTVPSQISINKPVDYSYIKHLPTFSERGTAIAKRLESIKGNPKYQALDEQHKTAVRADLYRQLVPDSYRLSGLKVPDEKTWVEASGRDTSDPAYHGAMSTSYGMQGATTTYGRRAIEVMQDTINGTNNAVDNVALFGIRATNRMLMQATGLAGMFSHPAPNEPTLQQKYTRSSAAKTINNLADTERHSILAEDFFHETHPRDTFLGQMQTIDAEMLVQAPLFAGIGKGVAALGTAAIKGVGYATGEQTLTKVLAATPAGAKVMQTLVAAADGVIGVGVATGGNKQAAEIGGILGIAGPLAGPILKSGARAEADFITGTIKYVTPSVIKDYFAKLMSQGGKPLATELVNSAAHESNEEIEGSLIRERRAANSARATNDPVAAKMHDAAKVSLNSIAVDMYGKPLRGITASKRLLVKARALSMVQEAAAEAPARLPAETLAETQQAMEKQGVENPGLKAYYARLEKLTGKPVASTVAENTVEQVKHETGMLNSDSAAKAVRGGTKRVLRTELGLDKEPAEGASASHGAPSTEADLVRKDRSQLQATLGERAKANWGAYYEQLKQARKVGVRFESPEHRMLFMYGNRESLPQELQDKLLYRMRQMKGYSTHEMSIADIQNRADWTHVHLLEMAHSGHFQPDEPGMFRSTKIGSPLDGTKYMMQMKREADNKQIAPLMAALKNHPKDMAIFRKSFQELNKENAAMFQEPAQWLQYRKALGVLVDSSLKRFTVMGHLF
jgi:hypothetical protein